MLLTKSAIAKREWCKRLKLRCFSTMLLPAPAAPGDLQSTVEQGPWMNLCKSYLFPFKTCRTCLHVPAKAFLVSQKGQVSFLSILCLMDLPALIHFSSCCLCSTTAVLLPAHFHPSCISCTVDTV